MNLNIFLSNNNTFLLLNIKLYVIMFPVLMNFLQLVNIYM